MECKGCGFLFGLKYPTGQKLKNGKQANAVYCPVCMEKVAAFDAEARPSVVLHEQL